MDDEVQRKLKGLIDAATHHVNKNGVVHKKTGARHFNKKLAKPHLILPGLPVPGKEPPTARGATCLTVARNADNTKARIQIIVQGFVQGEAIMSAQHLEQFIIECQRHLHVMKEGPKNDPSAVVVPR